MSRNVIDSRTSAKSVVESKSVLGVCTKVMVADEPQQWVSVRNIFPVGLNHFQLAPR